MFLLWPDAIREDNTLYNQITQNVPTFDMEATTMIIETTRKIGNSVGIFIPNEFKVPVGQQYIFHQNPNGSIIMVPKVENPYASDESFVPANNFASFERASMEEQT